jgi:hypothetical protein
MMVTPYDATRLFTTMQTDHSRVAGFLAAHWGNAAFATPAPWNSVVLAAQEHDRGWWQWECRPTLSDAGEPLDYQNDTLHHLGALRTTIYRSAIADVASIDPYAAVLVLDHLTGLLDAGHGAFSFRKDVSDDPVAKAFLDEQAAAKRTLIATLRRSPEFRDHCTDAQLDANCKVVEICDALAQFLCNRHPLDSTRRRGDPQRIFAEIPAPVGPGSPDVHLSLTAIDDRRLALDPYPFDVDPLDVNYVARWLPNRTYESRQAYLEDFYRAGTVAVHYVLQRA